MIHRFLYFQNGLRKETEISVETNFILHLCLKTVTQKSVVSPISCNLEKNTTLNTKGPRRGTEIIIMKMT